jgi:hypothetical protein
MAPYGKNDCFQLLTPRQHPGGPQSELLLAFDSTNNEDWNIWILQQSELW